MRTAKINNKINFKGVLNNKFLLKGLETAGNHPASFIAGTTLIMSSVVRPFMIAHTPETDRENKKYAIADAVSSGLIKFGITEMIALPVENAINRINKTPEKFLNTRAIKNYTEAGKTLSESKNYKFAQQLIKTIPNLVTAIPKSIITVALIPLVTDILFSKKRESNYAYPNSYSSTFAPFYNGQASFKGLQDTMTKGISKIFNAEIFQNIVKKHGVNDSNITRDMTMATDILLTASSVIRTKKSKKIKEENKNPLIYNKLITTAISILCGYKTDKMIQKGTKPFIEKFRQANINDLKLDKYIQGINVIRPTLIFALIYYGILPVISVFTADKLNKLTKKNNKAE